MTEAFCRCSVKSHCCNCHGSHLTWNPMAHQDGVYLFSRVTVQITNTPSSHTVPWQNAKPLASISCISHQWAMTMSIWYFKEGSSQSQLAFSITRIRLEMAACQHSKLVLKGIRIVYNSWYSEKEPKLAFQLPFANGINSSFTLAKQFTLKPYCSHES